MKTKFIKNIGKYLINKTAPEGGRFGDGILTHIPGKINIKEIYSINIWDILCNSDYTPQFSRKKKLEDIEFNHILFSIDYNKAQKEFGQQNGTFKGEFFYKIWLFEYMGFEFLLFCDSPNDGKGSSIEIIIEKEDYIHNKKIYDAVIGFQQKLYNIFKRFYPKMKKIEKKFIMKMMNIVVQQIT